MSFYSQAIESLFNIYNKEGTLVPFHLNQTQLRIDQELENSRRISILKYRQGGVSSYVMARFLVKCLSQHAVCVMLAHDRDHTEKLFQRAQLFLKKMNSGLQAQTSTLNKNEIFFTKTDSSFYIGTAGSKDFGRSATITDLHLSEIAFYKSPKTLLIGLLQCIPKDSGTVIQETTANGWGTWFQKRFYDYLQGKAGFKACFYPWQDHPEYVSRVEAQPPYSEEEETLLRDFKVSLLALQWRREKIEEFEGDLEAFKQEYPSTVKESFRLSGGSLFSDLEALDSESPAWKTRVSPSGTIFKSLASHPKLGYTYSFGADSAGGTGGDYSTIVGICLDTMEQVLEYSSNKIAPPAFGEVLCELGNLFNTAYLVPEANSHGLSVTYILKEHYSRLMIYKYLIPRSITSKQINLPSSGYGWQTTAVSKPYMVGIAQKFLKAGLRLHSAELIDQLISFTETQNHTLEGSGEHDDLGIALFLACIGCLKISQRLGIPLDFSSDSRVLCEKVSTLKKTLSDKAQKTEAFYQTLPSGKKTLVLPVSSLRGLPPGLGGKTSSLSPSFLRRAS